MQASTLQRLLYYRAAEIVRESANEDTWLLRVRATYALWTGLELEPVLMRAN